MSAPPPSRALLLVLLPLLSGCTPGDQPLDGGAPLDRTLGAYEERLVANDPCWRRERGAWHFSIGHCAEMLPAETMTGMWLTGWELSRFYPGETKVPGPIPWPSPRLGIELDDERVRRIAGRGDHQGMAAYAIALRFVGRRTRYPVHIDCYGHRDYMFVADRILDADYLGAVAETHMPIPSSPADLPPATIRRSGESGVVGRMEEEAIARCRR